MNNMAVGRESMPIQRMLVPSQLYIYIIMVINRRSDNHEEAGISPHYWSRRICPPTRHECHLRRRPKVIMVAKVGVTTSAGYRLSPTECHRLRRRLTTSPRRIEGIVVTIITTIVVTACHQNKWHNGGYSIARFASTAARQAALAYTRHHESPTGTVTHSMLYGHRHNVTAWWLPVTLASPAWRQGG